MTEDQFRDEPRTYRRMAWDGLRSRKSLFIKLALAFVGLQLFLNGVIATHLYAYKIELYAVGQFSNLEWWQIALDSAVWAFVFWKLASIVRSTEPTSE